MFVRWVLCKNSTFRLDTTENTMDKGKNNYDLLKFKHLFGLKYKYKLFVTCWDPRRIFLISLWSDKKHGCNGQFLVLIGRHFKNLLWNYKFQRFVSWYTNTNGVCEVLYKDSSFSFQLHETHDSWSILVFEVQNFV